MDFVGLCSYEEGSDIVQINFEDSFKTPGYRHAGHCCIYSRSKTPVVERLVSSALVSMQMRFDGKLGFHGGLVDKGQDVVSAVNRELVEEINANPKYFISQEDHLFSYSNAIRKIMMHFYAKEVSKEDFKVMEKDALQAKHYGVETMGIIRVPLFTMSNGQSGLPSFLRNMFAGCAKTQLLSFLQCAKLMSREEVEKALAASRKL